MHGSRQYPATDRVSLWLVFLLLLGLSSTPAFAQNKIVTLVSDPFPPHAMDEAERKGYVTEMVIKILEDAGYQAEYIKVPFKRALLGLKRGTYDGLLAVSPGRPGYIYTDNSFGTSVTSLFVAKDNAPIMRVETNFI
jgi:hypothetical protein